MNNINLRLVGLVLMATQNQADLDAEGQRHDLMSVDPQRVRSLVSEREQINKMAIRLGDEAVNLKNEAIDYMRSLRMKR